MENLRRDFFWGIKDGDRKIYWVAWEKILNSLDNGGLGIGSLQAHNTALLAKWWWRFKTDANALWRNVITAIHGTTGGLGEEIKVGVWGKIAGLNLVTENANISLISFFCRQIGNGENTKFWIDQWCGDVPLKVRFPRLAMLDNEIECRVADRILCSDKSKDFNWNWSRPITKRREISQINELERRCNLVEFEGSADKWVWRLDNSGGFSVSLLRSAIDDRCLVKTGATTRWNACVPLKFRLLFWRAQLDRLPTKENLMHKGIPLDSSVCVLCKEHSESGDHLFARCKKTWEVRNLINSWHNTFNDSCSNRQEVFGTFNNKKQASRVEIVRDAIIQAYTWVVWKGRNDEIFKGETFIPLKAANDIKFLVFMWVCNRCALGKKLSWNDWCLMPMSF